MNLVVMSVRILSNFPSLQLFNKNGNTNSDNMPSLSYICTGGVAEESYGSPEDEPSLFPESRDEKEARPQFTIRLGGGPQWWF